MYLTAYDKVSAAQLCEQIGERLKQVRLNRNITQEYIAQSIGISRRTVINAEKGQVTLENLVAMLQVLGLARQLDAFLPPQPVSPVQLARLQGSKRQRASGSGTLKEEISSVMEDSSW